MADGVRPGVRRLTVRIRVQMLASHDHTPRRSERFRHRRWSSAAADGRIRQSRIRTVTPQVLRFIW